MATSDLQESILAAWRTNARATTFLVEELPSAVWGASVPGAPRRTVRAIAAHLHNARRAWIRTIGKEHGVPVPTAVDRQRVGRRELASALERSGRCIEGLLELAFEHGGRIPIPSTYVWRNLPLDAGHILAYFAAHEGHHRGQIVLIARQLGQRLPVSTTGGIWQWTRLAREVRR
jgi:uncharacterized damage-inducible protein DinB